MTKDDFPPRTRVAVARKHLRKAAKFWRKSDRETDIHLAQTHASHAKRYEKWARDLLTGETWK